MKFLIDESAPKRLNPLLKAREHQSQTLHELSSLGISNGEVAKYAIESNAILISCDADFITFKKEIQRQIKVIYFKVHPRNFTIIKAKIIENLEIALKELKRPGIFTIFNNGYEFTPAWKNTLIFAYEYNPKLQSSRAFKRVK